MFTKEQLELMEKMESLVHRRFSKKDLQKIINSYFGVENKIKIDWNCFADGDLSDHNAMFSSWGLDVGTLAGDFDIYYLKCKKPNMHGDEVYVTEVGFEF